MRSYLILGGNAKTVFDLDQLSGRIEGEEPGKPSNLESVSGDFWSSTIADGGAVEISSRSARGESVGFGLEWDKRKVTWVLKYTLSDTVVLLNGTELRSSRPLVQDSCWLEIVDRDGSKGTRFLFKRIPEAPTFQNRRSREARLLGRGLLIGRSGKERSEDELPLLGLDPEIRSISSKQAEVSRDAKTGAWVLRNLHSTPLLVNGTSDYDQDHHTLVFGDCLQIPKYKYYTFQFDGQSLVHLGDGGAIQARGLEKVVKDNKKILSNVNLDLKCGEFVGVLGGSGQGKSTLMNAVCAISPATSGEVWLDGRELRSAADIADEAIGYVPQDDIVHRELTVREALEFAGKLRLATSTPQLRSAIDRVLNGLELGVHQNKRIRVLSGGQRKRVSIASELLTNPRFLFLDEPTSGLDPQTEWELMGLLHRLRLSRPLGIFCTTHVLQKSHVFDSVILVHGGRIIFKGPPVDAARYFLVERPFEEAEETSEGNDSSVRHSFSGDSAISESGEGISDERLLNSLSLVYGKIEGIFRKLLRRRGGEASKDGHDVVAEMERVYLDSSYAEPLDPLVGDSKRNGGGAKPKRKRSEKARRPGGWKTLSVLIARQWRILKAEPLNLVFLLAQAIVIGFLVGWVSENLVFQMFIAVIATLWFGCSNAAQQIVGELPIFRRERLAGVGLNVYLVGKFAFLTVITSVQALLLFATVLLSHHTFHPETLPLYPEPDRAENKKAFTEIFFSNRPEFMFPGVAAPPIPTFDGKSEDLGDSIAGFEVVFQDGLSS
ncbi:MAG: ATP-binding cassette domain-containing protein, partial [Verrucomicrobiota bacterium]